jgi:nucleoside 2-deoxyribosyltransferase
MLRIYLAGPDVFYPDAKERGEKLKVLCEKYGFEGAYPLDGDPKFEPDDTPKVKGRRIFEANIRLIMSCSYILANITPFRGPSVDAGTAFEIGFGAGCRLPVYGYTESKTEYKYRVQEDGLYIENFGMVDNLMIDSALECICDTPEEALKKIVGSMLDDA